MADDANPFAQFDPEPPPVAEENPFAKFDPPPAAPKSPQKRREEEAGEWSRGLTGWIKSQGAGALHGITSVTGIPFDALAALTRSVGRAATISPEERERTIESKRIRREGQTKGKSPEGRVSEPTTLTPGEEVVNKYIDPWIPTTERQRKILNIPGYVAWEARRQLPEAAQEWLPEVSGRATYNNIQEVPEHFRPSARFWEGVGSNYPFSWGASFGARNMPRGGLGASEQVSPSVMRNIINSQIEDQAKYAARTGGLTELMPKGSQKWTQTAGDWWKPISPSHHLGAQRASGFGAGAGGAGAELMFPGSDLAQFFGQGLGGVGGAAASAKIASAKESLFNRLVEPLSTLTDEGQKAAIARILNKEFQQYGEDPAKIIEKLSTPDEIPGALPAERSGSPVLMGVQKSLATDEDALANQITQQSEKFRGGIKEEIEGPRGYDPGDEGALTAAARDYDTAIRTEVAEADSAVQDITANLQGLSPAERSAANIEATNISERALQRARMVEKQAWDQTPAEAPTTPANGTNEYNAVRARMTPEQQAKGLPGNIDATMERWATVAEEGGTIPLWEVREVRSELLDAATEARASGNHNLARKLNQIANGEVTPGGGPGQPGGLLADMSVVGDPAVANARNVSVTLNDRFSRSHVGKLLGSSPEGGARVPAELSLETTFQGAGPVVSHRVRQMREAEAPIGEGPYRAEMPEVQERFMRTQTEKLINPDGTVKVTQAQKFLRDNAQTLEQFPQIREQVESAVRAQNAVDFVAVRSADKDKTQAFAKILASGEKPDAAVGKMLDGATPIRDLQRMAQLANNAGADAVAGLRSAIMKYVAGKANGSFIDMEKLLTQPLSGRKGTPTLLDAMVNDRLINVSQKNNIIGTVGMGARHERAPMTAARVSSVGTEADKHFKWGARFIGAKLAAYFGATGGSAGTSLQAAAIGASIAENALAKMPVGRARAIMRQAMMSEDPQQLLDILEKISPAGRLGGKSYTQPSLVTILRPLFPRTTSEGPEEGEENQWQRMNWPSLVGVE